MATQDKNSEMIDLASLPQQQLEQVREQLREEISHFSTSFNKLKQAQVTFLECKTNLNEINEGNKDNQILVPLTSSIYVPGQLRDVQKVIVDVGTGYYVEKSISSAKTYYDKKVKEIQANLTTLQDTIAKKRNNLNVLEDILVYKSNQALKASAKK
ncbi:Prefoldin alpha subunit [Neoconidiobolus thromboides FSU 785]|nr:Prefoldin alpha subunit [Neoconidiobolus thromboides FSU 785]